MYLFLFTYSQCTSKWYSSDENELVGDGGGVDVIICDADRTRTWSCRSKSLWKRKTRRRRGPKRGEKLVDVHTYSGAADSSEPKCSMRTSTRRASKKPNELIQVVDEAVETRILVD